MKHYTLILLVLALFQTVNAQNDFYGLMDKAYAELTKGNIPAARKDFEKAGTILPEKLPVKDKLVFFNNLGVFYYQIGEYKKGLDQYAVSLECARKTGVDSLVAQSLLNLALAYKAIGDYKNALKELISAAPVLEREGNYKELSSTWNAIGNIESDVGNFEKALKYHRMSLEIRKKINYDKGIADSYHNIGSTYKDAGKFDMAKIYLEEALRRKRKLNNQSNIVNTLSLLGQLYIDKGRPDKAFPYLDSAYNRRKEIGNNTKAMESLYYIGLCYAKSGNRSKAMELFQQTINYARLLQNRRLLANGLSGEIDLIKTGRESDSLILKYEELLKTREEIVRDDNRKEIARLEIKYDSDRKDREIQLQRLRNERLIGGLIFIALLTAILTGVFFLIRRRNRILARQKEEITYLHHELSHRTQNYLMLLSGMLISDETAAYHDETLAALKQVRRRIEAMSLVQQYLLDDAMQKKKEVQLIRYLNEVVDSEKHLLPVNCELALALDMEEICIDHDIAMRLGIALNELVCNTLKHGIGKVESPKLSIMLEKKGNEIVLIVQDNGPGIQESQAQAQSVKGQELIAKLLYKVNGRVDYRNENGCVASVSILL